LTTITIHDADLKHRISTAQEVPVRNGDFSNARGEEKEGRTTNADLSTATNGSQ
jgi:hypothetical protein